MPYPQFDRSKIKVKPLGERKNDVTLADLIAPNAIPPEFDSPELDAIAERVRTAHQNKKSVILMMGAHVIKSGLNRVVIDLMEKGVITHLATNGAGPIHDFELALIGATSESVANYIKRGEFGLWKETGQLNEIAKMAVSEGIGFGEAIGKTINTEKFPNRDISLFAAAYRLGIPATVHIGIGYDIIHEHPNCDGGALGKASYTDFLVYTHSVSKLEGGVLLSFGSAVMGPEVYLKALSMSRNVAEQNNEEIRHFTTGVFDIIPLSGDIHHEAPKSDPRYYYRPYKTILVRTVADGGESYYVCGDHKQTLPNLRAKVLG